MTHDERISSYIDNELSSEQEQEFLISLASSDGLRKSFRSELVLKNVLHRDGAVTEPPREMRSAIFATLGLGIATGGITATKANAAARPAVASHSVFKTLFATKVNALIIAAGISISALAGYGVHSIVTADHTSPTVRSSQITPAQTLPQPLPAATVIGQSLPANTASTERVSNTQVSSNQHSHRMASRANAIRQGTETGPVSGVAGGGGIEIQTPVVKHQ
jgi:negative regulator of sigma E activity